jgi:hypothetical protein
MTNNHELASRNGLTAERSLEPFAERRKCAMTGHSGGSIKLVLTFLFASIADSRGF